MVKLGEWTRADAVLDGGDEVGVCWISNGEISGEVVEVVASVYYDEEQAPDVIFYYDVDHGGYETSELDWAPGRAPSIGEEIPDDLREVAETAWEEFAEGYGYLFEE